jgi:hypothetical protein
MYPKYILNVGNPLKEKFSLIFTDPKIYFVDTVSTKAHVVDVSHMFKRVVSENRFKELRSLKDISK